MLASTSVKGMRPFLGVTGAVDAEVFEVYLKLVFLSELRPRRVVMMDNLSVHKS